MQRMQNVSRDYFCAGFNGSVPLEFYQLENEIILTHGKAKGRIAFNTSLGQTAIDARYNYLSQNGKLGSIHTKPATLETPGRPDGDVSVVILQDPDEYEICFVDEKGFDSLCTVTSGVHDQIAWKQREELGADQNKGQYES